MLYSASKEQEEEARVITVSDKQESTGIKGADDFRAAAQALDLIVETRIVNSEAVYFKHNGEVMIPASKNVMLTVTIPVPEELGNNALTLEERSVLLSVCWKLDLNGRARGRWILGNYRTLGYTEDMHMLKRCYSRLELMNRSLQQLRRFAEER